MCNIRNNVESFFFTFQEVEQLRQEKLEIDQQLRSIHGSTMGSMQSLQMSRRNDRGYSSDMDGGGRGRGGSMRGRGGRGRGGPGRQNDSRYNAGSTNSDYVNNVERRGRSSSDSNGRGRGGNGRSSRGGPGGDRGSNKYRSNRGRPPVDMTAGTERDRK